MLIITNDTIGWCMYENKIEYNNKIKHEWK